MLTEIIIFLSLGSEVSANCGYGTSIFPRLHNVHVSEFGYDNITGPLDWYHLNSTANSACDIGTHQSPIVINANSNVSSVPGTSFQWTVENYPDGAEFENLGSTVEVVVNGTLVDSISNTAYHLHQFHFHTPSEHRIEDEYFPMEMHMVHESDDHQIAVIGFLLELCEGENCGEQVLKQLFSGIYEIAEPGSAEMSAPLDFNSIVQQFGANGVYRYSGSLTTPPCAEGVDWIISKKLLYIDLQTYLAVKKVVKFNSRYTQNELGAVNLLQNAANELN